MAITNVVGFKNFTKMSPGADPVPMLVNVTIPVGGISVNGDKVNLASFPAGLNVLGVQALSSGAAGTGFIGNLVIATGCTYPDELGTETVIYTDTGTRWVAAKTDHAWLDNAVATPASDINGLAYLRLSVTAKAGTPAAFAMKLLVWLTSKGG